MSVYCLTNSCKGGKDVICKIIGGIVIAVGFAAAYISGRDEGRRQEARRQSQESPIWMEHEHGGEEE